MISTRSLQTSLLFTLCQDVLIFMPPHPTTTTPVEATNVRRGEEEQRKESGGKKNNVLHQLAAPGMAAARSTKRFQRLLIPLSLSLRTQLFCLTFRFRFWAEWLIWYSRDICGILSPPPHPHPCLAIYICRIYSYGHDVQLLQVQPSWSGHADLE